jgi:DNA-binding winged helix-turn-helix (wHTH) protein
MERENLRDLPGGKVATVLESGFRLGSWVVRPRLGTMDGPGGSLHLEPKVMGVRLCLAEHAGDVVIRGQGLHAR